MLCLAPGMLFLPLYVLAKFPLRNLSSVKHAQKFQNLFVKNYTGDMGGGGGRGLKGNSKSWAACGRRMQYMLPVSLVLRTT